MQKGAEAVHSANPDVIVILSGLNYDKDLSFLRNRPMNLTFSGKIVFEVHWYSFTDGEAWKNGNSNQVCGRVVDNMMRVSGFLLDQGWPLFVSEFGVDQRGTNVNDNRYLGCFLSVAAELDLDWALWTLVGSYYLRQGVIGMNEYYGVLNWNWREVRNSTFLQLISALQSPFRGIAFVTSSLFISSSNMNLMLLIYSIVFYSQSLRLCLLEICFSLYKLTVNKKLIYKSSWFFYSKKP
jgi:hypothetical protein